MDMYNSTEMSVVINNDRDNLIVIDVEGSYTRHEDDPAYDPGSGNSMTCTYRPEYTYELDEVDIELGDVEQYINNLGNTDVEVCLEYEYTTRSYKDNKWVSSQETHSVTSTVVKASDYKLIQKFIYTESFSTVDDMIEYDGD